MRLKAAGMVPDSTFLCRVSDLGTQESASNGAVRQHRRSNNDELS